MKRKIFFKSSVLFVLILGAAFSMGTYAALAAKTYTITASAGEHGSISPEGNVMVNAGGEAKFDMIPDPGYVMDNVVINGISLGAIRSWTFTPVNSDHQIHATFKQGKIPQYLITATSGAHGKIHPAGEIVVNYGEDKMTFTMIPDTGYIVNDLLIDGASIGAKNTYTFPAIDKEHTIQVSFKKEIKSETASQKASEAVSEKKTRKEIKQVKISGSVKHEKKALCALVLANDQHQFSCDKNIGKYEIKVPLDKNGEITLFGFSEGFAPFKEVLKPSGDIKSDIKMLPPKPDAKKFDLTIQASQKGVKKSGAIKIKGSATYQKKPLRIMVLANRAFIFTDEKKGTYELEVIPDKEGKITVLGFCEGFLPFKQVVNP